MTAETKPSDPARRRIIAGAGSQIVGGLLRDLDDNTDVRNERWYGTPWKLGLASKMMRDPIVRQAVGYVIDPLLGATWDFEPAGSSELAQETADWCRHVFFERNDWQDALRSTLYYVRDGFSLVEQTDAPAPFDARRFPKHVNADVGIGIVISGFHGVPSWSLDANPWIQSRRDPRRLFAVRQNLPGSDAEDPGVRTIFADRLIRATWEHEGGNFAGFAPLRSGHPPWRLKSKLQIIEVIKHEREHNGIPTFEAAENTTEEELDELGVIAGELRANEKAFLVYRKPTEFAFKNSSGSTSITDTIQRCDRDILANVGAGWSILGQNGQHGSFGLAGTLRGAYEISLDKHARFVEGVYNFGPDGFSPVERSVRLNFGASAPVPRLVARDMPTTAWDAILPLLHNLTMSGHITPDDRTEAFVRRVVRAPPHDIFSARARPPVASAAPMNVGPSASPPDPDASPASQPSRAFDDKPEDEEMRDVD